MNKRSKYHKRMISRAIALALGTIVSSTSITPVHAQDSDEGGMLEEVTVTGSRIRRQDFTANAPITTVDQVLFEQTATIGVETVLNQLPQFVPAVTQFDTFDIQNAADNTVGASVVSLRGLGPNRNLVLIDGRRGTPVNGALVTDTNMIPSAAIERVEIISGGASAVYGADAVGGVVNFLLKDDYEGATVNTTYGITQEGDNPELQVNALFGSSMADGRGNVMLGIEHSRRDTTLNTERDWRVREFADNTVGGTDFWLSETYISSDTPGPAGWPSQAAIDTTFPTLAAGTIPRTASWFINPTSDGTGTVFTGGGNFLGGTGAAGALAKYDGPFEHPDFPGLTWRKHMPDGRIVENSMYTWASTPLDRYSTFARGTFDFTDNITGNIQASFARNRNETQLGFFGAGLGANNARVPYGSEIWEDSVVSFGADGLPNTADAGEDMTTNAAYLPGGLYQLNCAAGAVGGCTETETFPLPAEMQALLNSRTNPDGDIRVNRSLDFMGPRRQHSSTTTFQIVAGLEGELANGWFWDVHASHGQTETVVNFEGIAARERWRSLVASPNFGIGFQALGNEQGGGFAGGQATCTTGLPIVRDFEPSQDCVDAMAAHLQNNTQLEQNIVEANITGDAWELPAGTLQFAMGATYRDDRYAFQTDDYTTNQSFTENALGLFPTNNTFGEFDVYEFYGELLVPVVRDLPLMREFNIELGGRYSDYSTVGGVETYKVLGDWGIVDWARLRGGFNLATRAPNLSELFQSRTQIFAFGSGVFGDQCSANPAMEGPYSANPAANVNGATGAAATEALCRQIMGATGAAEYYDSRAVTAQPGAGAGEGLPNIRGNINTQPEEASTWTVGLVLESPSDNPWLANLSASIDYYNIEITDMIATENADSVFARCLNPDLNPGLSPSADGCLALGRDPLNGNQVSVDTAYTNQGRALFEGLDLQLDWSAQLSDLGIDMVPGNFSINMLANVNLRSMTQSDSTQPKNRWEGTLGCDLQMQCQRYNYRIFTTFSYFYDKWTANLRWQHYPSIDAAAVVGTPTSTVIGVPSSYDMIALNGTYTWSDNLTLRFGIENLFDKEPPLGGGNPNATPYPMVNTHQSGATYDPLGRRFFFGATLDF